MDHKASANGSLRILTGENNRAQEAEGAGLDAPRGTSYGSLVPGWHLHVSACGQKGLNSTRQLEEQPHLGTAWVYYPVVPGLLPGLPA